MISRGDIYYADLGTRYLCEQGGVRPVVILQNDKGNAFGPTTIIAPITSQSKNKRFLPTHMLIHLNRFERLIKVVCLIIYVICEKKI